MRDINYWRMKRALYRLEGNHCQQCGMLHFPQRLVCSQCHTRALPPLPSKRPAATHRKPAKS